MCGIAHLDLVGDDGPRTQRCTDLVCMNGVKIAQADLANLFFGLKTLQMLQRD